MKKNLFFITSFLFAFTIAYSQINVNSNGNVGIGANAVNGIQLYSPEAKIIRLAVNKTPDSSFEFDVEGVSRFFNGTISGLLIENYNGFYEMALRPSINRVCQ